MAKTLSRLISSQRAKTDAKHAQNAAYNEAVRAGTAAPRTFDPSRMSQRQQVQHARNQAFNQGQQGLQGGASGAGYTSNGEANATGYGQGSGMEGQAGGDVGYQSNQSGQAGGNVGYQGGQSGQAGGNVGYQSNQTGDALGQAQSGVGNISGQGSGQSSQANDWGNPTQPGGQATGWGNPQQPRPMQGQAGGRMGYQSPRPSANNGGRYRVSPGVYRNRPPSRPQGQNQWVNSLQKQSWMK